MYVTNNCSVIKMFIIEIIVVQNYNIGFSINIPTWIIFINHKYKIGIDRL